MEEKNDKSSLKDIFIPFTNKKAFFIIAILGFIVFGNMLFNGFAWDDKSYILFNEAVHTPNLAVTFGSNLFNTIANYRPIPATYFSLLYFVFKDFAFPYHLLQLILHIVNASLVFILFKKFFSKPLSLFLSIIFLVHPIQIESVSFIASTGNNLFFLFGITALLLAMKNEITEKGKVLICLLLLLSLLSKETGGLFIFVIPVYRTLFKKKTYVKFYIYEFVTVLLYLFIRFVIGNVYFTKLEIIPISRLPFFERIVNIPAVIFYYVKTFLFPAKLSIQQYWLAKLDMQTFYVPLVCVLALFLFLGLLGAHLFRADKKVFSIFAFFCVWLGLGFFMHSQIFPLDFTVSDRWFYFPIVGALGIIGISLESLKFYRRYIKLFITLGVICIVLLSLRTITRNLNWYDSLTLYTHDAKIQDNFDIENNIGAEYGLLHRYKDAIRHYKKSAEMFPQEASEFNIGLNYEQMGNSKKAEEYYYKALDEKNYTLSGHKHELDTYMRLAWVLILSKQFEKAEKVLKIGLSDHPNSSKLLMQLGVVRYALHDDNNALRLVGKAKKISPSDNEVNYTYSQILGKKSIELKNNNATVILIGP